MDLMNVFIKPMLVKFNLLVKEKTFGNNFIIIVIMPRTPLVMDRRITLLAYEHMFCMKPILHTDVDMNKLSCVKDISSTQVNKSAAEHHEVLTIAMKNVATAQMKQKEQNNRKHCKPGLLVI